MRRPTRPRFAPLLTIFALTALLIANPARACRLALVLGFDVSRSVNDIDYRLQVDGIVAALFDPEVRGLILEPSQPVAMAVFEWAGQVEQQLVADWTLLNSAADIDLLAQQILTHTRRERGLTAVGSALTYARRLIAHGPACTWQTIDLAGDGQINDGPEPRRIYDTTDFGDIVVNGLAIGVHEHRIEDWFRRNVLHGPGAFLEFTPTHEDFAEAFRRKLIRELREPVLGLAPPPSDHG
ncbi:DUF1194 domain-containing protein [Pararhodobacter oceanensis]|uniref:DUF1194 domain-containing protein n=1 Tax=Pararhodobacter oceanensis TaxID=2172121 RepID=UPI003A91DB1D